jgi:iron(III) transport system substrate-binding protein
MEETMMRLTMNRRTVLAGLALSTAVGLTPALAQSTAPYEVTPALIEAAKKEGTVTFYTATDVAVAERVGKAFEEKYPGSRSRSSGPAPSACSSASARSMAATS